MDGARTGLACVAVFIAIFDAMCVEVCIAVSCSYTHENMYVKNSANIYIHISNTGIHACMHAYIHTYMHAYIRTYMPT